MSCWNNKREYFVSARTQEKMIAIGYEYPEEYENLVDELTNGTDMTSVHSDVWATELTLTDAEWKQAIDNCRNIVNKTYKKLFTS